MNPIISDEAVNDGLHDVLAIEHSAVGLGTGVSGAGVEIRAAVGDIHCTNISVREMRWKTVFTVSKVVECWVEVFIRAEYALIQSFLC